MKLKIIFTTTSSKENAKKMAKSLVESKLSPCVQMVKNIKSTYRWNDEVKSEKEYLLMIKVAKKNVAKCMKMILDEHDHDIPEIMESDATILNDSYGKWFKENSK